MSFANLIRVAIRAILNNKIRTLLSMLGIIIGVIGLVLGFFWVTKFFPFA